VDDVTTLEGPIEKIDGKLVVRIPLDAGGDQFIDCSRGIATVDAENLVVIIPQWLADKLLIEEGDLITVSNANGRFDLSPSNPRPIH
jgi:hypothetical protein